MAKTTRHGLGEALDLDRKFDRITPACGAQMWQPEASREGDDALQLTLDNGMRASMPDA